MHTPETKNGEQLIQLNLFRRFVKEYRGYLLEFEDSLLSASQNFSEGQEVTQEQYESASNLIQQVYKVLFIYHQSLEKCAHLSNLASYGQALITALRYIIEQTSNMQLLLSKFSSINRGLSSKIQTQLEIYYLFGFLIESCKDAIHRSSIFLDQSYFQEKILDERRLLHDKPKVTGRGKVIPIAKKRSI